MNELGYPPKISILPTEEGVGYLIEFPDLPGCISDGDTIDDAIANGKDAILCWIETAKQYGDVIPQPQPSLPASEHFEEGIKREENPLSINHGKVIRQYEPFAIAPLSWEFEWSVTSSVTI